MENLKILIIEDEEYNRNFYYQILKENYFVETSADLIDGEKKCIDFKPELILLDLKFDREESTQGLDFLKKIKRQHTNVEVIVISGSRRDSTKIDAILKYGAFDYLEKPIRQDVLLLVVNRVKERIRLKSENERLKKKLAKTKGSDFYGMIGTSHVMKDVYNKIEKIAHYDSTVLITGQTGTGKELVARAIHLLSGRDPFVAIDMGTIASDLAASELFGHQRGSFTGAITERKGKIESAAQGTVFLDEIENVSLDSQQKLLRVLEQKTFERVGSNVAVQTNARFIVASNVDLRQYVKLGKFREDLFHRLNVLSIHVPSLKERVEDIELLARYFLSIHSKSLDIYKKLTPQTVKLMREYDWPGNVRELKNSVEEALIFGLDENSLLPEDFQFYPLSSNKKITVSEPGLFKTLKQIETEAKKNAVALALRENNGVIAKAARFLDITPRHLRRLIDEFEVLGKDNFVDKGH